MGCGFDLTLIEKDKGVCLLCWKGPSVKTKGRPFLIEIKRKIIEDKSPQRSKSKALVCKALENDLKRKRSICNCRELLDSTRHNF